MQHVLPLFAALLCAVPLRAQDPLAAERELATFATTALRAYADALEAAKMNGRATEVRREILLEYVEDDAQCRQKLGYVKVGSTWRRDESLPVQNRDLGDPKGLRKLEQDWDKTCKELGKRHEAVAEQWQAAGNAERAAVHWRRVLRFQPADAKAVQQLRLSPFDGFLGEPRELTILRRSRAIRDGVQFLTAWEPVLEPIDPKEKQPILDKAKVAAAGIRTRHFQVWGSLPQPQLVNAAKWAERSLLLCRTVFAGLHSVQPPAPGAMLGPTGRPVAPVEDVRPFQPELVLDIALVSDTAAYERVLTASKDLFPPERLAFLKTLQQAFIPSDHGELRLVCAKSEAEALDQVVRGVAQDAIRYKAHGLWEGIGHAFCGFCFGQTLTFMLEQQQQHTSTGYKPQRLLPDIKTWAAIATETAWAKVDTPTARLTLLNAARFTNEERVKAWAMVDWLLRWRPELVPELDKSHSPQTVTEADVEAEFKKRTGIELAQLDKDWRDYWGRSGALRAAIAAAPRGDKAAVDGARALAFAVDTLRAAADVGPLGYYVPESEAAVAAGQYLAALVKAEADRKTAKPGTEVPDPEPPAQCNRLVLATPESNAAAAVAAWSLMPAVRDVLLHPGRILLGCSQDKAGCVLDLTEPETAFTGGMPSCWPANGQRDVPASARADSLGALVLAALQQRKIQPDAQVGVPLTLHFFRKLPPGEAAAVSARATAQGGDLDGVLVCLQREGDRTSSAAGCFAFVPLQPLPPGAQVKVRWDVPRPCLPRGEHLDVAVFTVRK